MTVTFGDPNYETEEVLKVRDITKSYDGREILHNVSFNIRNRERVALLGANGAGKTTMLKILLGEEVPDGGVIRKGVGLKPAYLPQQVYFANPHATSSTRSSTTRTYPCRWRETGSVRSSLPVKPS